MRGIKISLVSLFVIIPVVLSSTAVAGELIDVGGNIQKIIGDPVRNEVYATLDTGEVIRADLDTLVVSGRITPPWSPGPIAVAPDGSRLYVALRDTYDVAIYELPSMVLDLIVPTSCSTEINDLTAGSHRVYGASPVGMTIIDTDIPEEIAFDPGNGLFYEGDLLLTPDEETVIGSLNLTPTIVIAYDVTTDDPKKVGQECCHGCIGSFARSMVVSPDGGSIYLAVASIQGVQVLNRPNAGLFNRTHMIHLDSDPNSVAISPDGETVYIGFFPGNIAFARTSDQLVFRVEPAANTIVSDGLVVSSDGGRLAVALAIPSAPDAVEVFNIIEPQANRGGMRVRPVDSIVGIPVSNIQETIYPFDGAQGFVDVQAGFFARGPLEPGAYNIELSADGYVSRQFPVTIGSGVWTDLGDVTMTRTGSLPRPLNICASPAVIAGETSTLAVHGTGFHPDAIVTSTDSDEVTILSTDYQDWSAIEVMVSAPYQSSGSFLSEIFKVENPDGSWSSGNAFAIPGGLSVISLETATASVTEPDGSITVQVTRTGGSGGEIVANFDTSNHTAVGGLDFTHTSGSLIWDDGDTAPKTITVPIIDDSEPEGPETFSLEISTSSQGAVIGEHQETVITIEDDDSSTVRFVSATAFVDETAGTVVLTVQRGGDIGDPASVQWSTVNGSAVAGQDYVGNSGTIDWLTGQADDRTVQIAILDDAYPEIDEAFTVELSNPGGNAYLGEPAIATVTIHSDDVVEIVFSVSDYAEDEGNGTATVTALRTGTSFGAVSAQLVTEDATAVAGLDYQATIETLSWLDGETTPKTAVIPLIDDATVEPHETINLSLVNPTGGATVGTPGTAELTIIDNDGTLLRFTSGSFSVDETAGTAEVSVERLGGDNADLVTVGITTADGTAVSGSDYLAASSTLVWPAGDSSDKHFTVTIIDDSLLESVESFYVNLSGPTGHAAVGNPDFATVAILDDEWSESRLNSVTDQPQTRPDAAMTADGRAVVVWESFLQDGSGWGVFGQRFNAAGNPEGVEFQVNAGSSGNQRYPAVAMRSDGGFTVVWLGSDADGDGIVGRRFDAGGSPIGGDEIINPTTNGDQTEPDVAVDGTGAGLVLWQTDHTGDLEIRGRRLDATGAPTGDEIVVNSTTTIDQQLPAVAGSPVGGFVAAWQSYGQDGPGEGIVIRLFASTGTPLSGEIIANEITAGNQLEPDVGATGDGSFVVAWSDPNHRDGSLSSIQARWFDASASPLGGDIQVNTYTTGDQTKAAVACAGPDDAVILWQSDEQDGSNWGVYGQPLQSSGDPIGPELRFNTHAVSAQHDPAVARSDAGTFWAVWASTGQDGSGDGVYGLFGETWVATEIFADGFESGDTGEWD